MSHDLRVERRIGAPPDVVFDLFTDPAAQRELYAEAPDWVVESACDLRVGGRWTIRFGPPGSPAAVETNTFRVVDRPTRLVFASSMRMPRGELVETLVEVTFAPEGDRTRLTIVQTGFPTAAHRDEIEQGWPSILDQLDRLAAGRR